MLLDLAAAQDWRAYRFVVVGSGFAGLFLAEKLASHGRVLVIEAGPLDEHMALGRGYYDVQSTGIPTPALGARLSAFGGTSNHWTGQSRPFSPTIFGNRSHLGIAGWPITYREYAAYLPEAQAWLNLPPSYDLPDRPGIESGLLEGMPGLTTQRFFSSLPLLHLGYQGTRERFIDNPAIDVLVDTRVIDLELDPGGTRVAALQVARADGSRHRIPAETVLLAAGGIENARLMLWAGRKYQRGNPLLGGPNELTGKYYSEHPVFLPAEIYYDHRLDLSQAMLREFDQQLPQFFLWMPEDEMLERHRLTRFGVLHYDQGLSLDPSETADLDAPYLSASQRYKVSIPAFKFEQTPHTGSFVGLSDLKDRDGTALPRVHWALTGDDFDRFRRATLLFCGLISQRGHARVRLRPQYRTEDWSALVPTLSSHHLGTTRMAHATAHGVVDTDSRVFGIANLYVAGASVFPHGDFLNPTLNFLALAARLADHLTGSTSSDCTVYRFGAGRPWSHLLGEGWSGTEERGRWTEAPLARITVPRAGLRGFRIYGTGFRKAGVTVSANGRQVFSGTVEQLANNRYPEFTSTDFPSGETFELVFSFTNLVTPAQLGESDDGRLLGYFIQWLEVW